MVEVLPKYLEDPERYCSRINSLLNQNSNEWQTVWKAAIPELCNLSCNKLRDINSLLKPIESAFKSKDFKLRVQAFECWSHFLSRCPEISVSKSEKLWNVLAVPLTAQNHSVFIVLSAKLKTWDAFIDAAFQSYPNALKTVLPSLLKCLYGPTPQTVEPACKFSALYETCGLLYLKIMKKCSAFPDEISLIFSYLGKAIPPLSNSPNAMKLAKLIWSEALNIMAKSNWQAEHFNYLIRTLENLFSDHQNDGFQLLGNFLAIIFDIHVSLPPDRLTPHMNLLIRCLFRPPVKKTVISDIMNSMLKRCENPSFYFYEVDRVLMDKIKDDKTSDLDVLWIAVASCYTKWVKTKTPNRSGRQNDANEIDTSMKILLFPVEHFDEISYETDRFNEVMKQWKLCYEECAMSSGSENFMPVFFEKMEASIGVRISQLIVATYMCNAVMTVAKCHEGFIHMKEVLLKIRKNLPDIKQLTDSKLKTFAIKYIVTIKAFVQFVKPCQTDFSDVIETFSFLLPKDANEVTSKADLLKSGPDGDSSSKLLHQGSNDTLMTPTRKRSSFLASDHVFRLLSPSVSKSNVQSPGRSPSTPKSAKIDDDDVQVIEIKPKAKNSPLTQHQLEKAKSKRYIPALYQDLSQDLSQSHSQSLTQTDSENLFLENKKPNISINPELFEENANLPAITNTSNIVPRSLSFSTGLNSPASNKSGKDVSKVPLFNNDVKHGNNSDSDSSIEVIPKSETFANAASNDCGILDKQPTKRKNPKESETPNDITPVKRSKRLMNRVENGVGDKNNTKTCKFTIPPSDQKSVEKPCVMDDTSTNDRANEPEVIDLEEEPSDVVAVKTKSVDNVCVSRTVNSLLTLRDENGKSSEKRKSLRKRGNDTSTKASLRKLRSNLFENDSKKSDSDDSVSDQQSTRDVKKPRKKKSSNLLSTYVVVQESEEPPELDKTGSSFRKLTLRMLPSKEISTEKNSSVAEKVSSVAEKEPSIAAEKEPSVAENTSSIAEKESSVVEKNTPASPKKSILNDSVILVDEGVTEVISIDDSESVDAAKKPDEDKICSSVPDTAFVPVPNSSDESTFYEGSDLNIANKEQPIVTPNDEHVVKEKVQSVDQNATVPNISEVEKLSTSPEVTSSSAVNDNTVENNNVADDCTTRCPIETSAIESNPGNSAPVFENSHESVSNESECSVQSSSKKDTFNDEFTTNEANLNDSDRAATESEPSSLLLNPNSRGFYIRSLVQGSDFPVNSSKSPKTASPKHTHRIRENLYRSPISSRTSKILFENNKLPSTPTQRGTPTPEENGRSPYTPRNYPRRSILKTPDSKRSDANQITSPKSPKLRVSFAEKDQIKLFQADDESDSDSSISTGDNLSNDNNLINEKLRSQDMLYSPLQNCKDKIESVLDNIFGSAGSRLALKFFKSIGIDKVGQLASMSTLTASSIPAGDNRVKRIRHALKKYDKELQTKRRRPSTRRSEFKSIEVSCLMDFPFDVDSSADTESYSEEETEELPKTDDPEPMEETSSKEVLVTLSERQTSNEEPMDTNVSAAAPILEENETENDEFTEAKVPKELVVVLTRSMELETPVIEDINNVESTKLPEKEIVKEVENKENVDPRMDIDTISESDNISGGVVQPMQVDEHPRTISKATNESINESADYVCTDSTTREEDKNDRRSITMRDIHRYSTVIESNGEEVEKTSETAIVVSNTNVNESGSLSNENEIISESEKVIELQKSANDSQETSISVMDSVVVIPSDQQSSVSKHVEENEENEESVKNGTSTENEIVASETIFSNDDNFAQSTIPQDVNGRDTTSDSKNIEQSIATCQEEVLNSFFEDCFDGVTKIHKAIYPYTDHPKSSTRQFFFKLLKDLNSLKSDKYKGHFVIEENN